MARRKEKNRGGGWECAHGTKRTKETKSAITSSFMACNIAETELMTQHTELHSWWQIAARQDTEVGQ